MLLRLRIKTLLNMKKGYSIIIAFLFAITIYGQGFTGFVFGGNMSFLTGDSTTFDKRSPKYGFYGGIMRDIYIDRFTYIQWGVFYSAQGAIYRKEYYDKAIFYRDNKILKINYIHIPVVWKQNWEWIFTELGGYVNIVPGTANAIWQQEIHYADSIYISAGEYFSFSKEIRLYDIGLVMGLGYQFKVNEQFDMFFNIRYKPGFIRINRGYVAYPEYSSKNQVFTLSIGLINIGKIARHRLTSRKLKR